MLQFAFSFQLKMKQECKSHFAGFHSIRHGYEFLISYDYPSLYICFVLTSLGFSFFIKASQSFNGIEMNCPFSLRTTKDISCVLGL